jgi:hypothetical protein
MRPSPPHLARSLRVRLRCFGSGADRGGLLEIQVGAVDIAACGAQPRERPASLGKSAQGIGLESMTPVAAPAPDRHPVGAIHLECLQPEAGRASCDRRPRPHGEARDPNFERPLLASTRRNDGPPQVLRLHPPIAIPHQCLDHQPLQLRLRTAIAGSRPEHGSLDRPVQLHAE